MKQEVQTPCYVIDNKALDKNISDFVDALKTAWPNSQLAFSVKTNSLPWLLKYLHTKKVFAEVVSDEEYELAIKCGYTPKEIIFNGPIKGKRIFIEAINNGSIVNMDSKKELKLLQDNGFKQLDNIGVRVNLDTSLFDSKDVGYLDDGFRFGFSDSNSDLKKAFSTVNDINKK